MRDQLNLSPESARKTRGVGFGHGLEENVRGECCEVGERDKNGSRRQRKGKAFR